MKAASSALIALLASNQYLYADLFTITLRSGAVLYYTNGDGAITYGGNTYLGTSPQVSRSGSKSSVDPTVDTMKVTLHCAPADLVSGVTFPQFATNGGFDSATVQVDRCFMATFGDTSAGVLNVFFGMVTDAKPSRTAVELEVSSMLALLNIQMPRNVYMPGCNRTLFDAGCGLTKASFAAATTAASGSTAISLICALTQAAAYFALGTVTFTTGANAGVSRTVQFSTVGVINLSQPLPSVPAVGDAFTAYPGCDKVRSTCGGGPNTYTVAASVLTCAQAHGLTNGTQVKVATTSAAPAPLVVGTVYYVVNATAKTLKLAATSGGTAITITTAGTGTQTVRASGKFDNGANFRGFPYIPIPTVSL